MTVEAECSNCGDVHPLGDRRLPSDDRHLTTVCPACGSPSYTTKSPGERITKSERERIHDAIKDVDGVGKKNLAAVLERYSTLAELEAADVDEYRPPWKRLDPLTDGGQDIEPMASEERHIYFSTDEYSKFLRGVPIERHTDGLELTIFPPERASLPVAIEGLREYAEFLERAEGSQ